MAMPVLQRQITFWLYAVSYSSCTAKQYLIMHLYYSFLYFKHEYRLTILALNALISEYEVKWNTKLADCSTQSLSEI